MVDSWERCCFVWKSWEVGVWCNGGGPLGRKKALESAMPFCLLDSARVSCPSVSTQWRVGILVSPASDGTPCKLAAYYAAVCSCCHQPQIIVCSVRCL